MSKTPVWFDADMGSDDVLAILMALGSDQFTPLGLSTVFGNVSGDKSLNNARELLSAFGQTNIPLYRGAAKPLIGPCLLGDNAYGEDGFGGIRLSRKDPKNIIEQSEPAHLALIDKVLSQSEKVTIFGTGPATNLALALQELGKDPIKLQEFKQQVKLVLMSGAFQPGPHPNPSGRVGNITLHSEFNAHMDPYSLNRILQSYLETHIVMLDATQHTSLTQSRQDMIRSAISEELADKLIAMIKIVEELDTTKFGSDGPFMHDPQVVAYALDPQAFEARHGILMIDVDRPKGFDPSSRHGRYRQVYGISPSPPILVQGIQKSPDEIFGAILSGIKNIAPEYRS